MRASPSAAASSLQVQRTMSAPAEARAYTWASVPSTSAVLVVVMDCTVTGVPPPTGTSPIMMRRVTWRGLNSSADVSTDQCGNCTGWVMSR